MSNTTTAATTTSKITLAKNISYKRKDPQEEIVVHDMSAASDAFFPKTPYDARNKAVLLDYLTMFHQVVKENQRKRNVSIYDALSSYVVEHMPRTAQLSVKLFDKYTVLPQNITADVVVINQKIVNCKAIKASILLVRCEKFAVENLVCANAALIESESVLTIDSLEASCALLRCESYAIGEILNRANSQLAAQDKCKLPYQAKSLPPAERSDLADENFFATENEIVAKNYRYGYKVISKFLDRMLEEPVMGLFYDMAGRKLKVMMLELCAQEINPQTGQMDNMITAERFLQAFTHLDPAPLLDRTIGIILEEMMDEFLRRFKIELPLIPVEKTRKLIIYCLTEYLYARYIEAFRTKSDKLKKDEAMGKWNLNFAISAEIQELMASGKTLEEFNNENEFIFLKDIAMLSKGLRTRFRDVQFSQFDKD